MLSLHTQISSNTTPVLNKMNSIIQHKYKQKGIPHIFIFPMQYEKHLFDFLFYSTFLTTSTVSSND